MPPSTLQVPEAMAAAVLCGPDDLQVQELPVPAPATGEVLVRVAMCGICGTDLAIAAGAVPQTLPYGEFVPGHEWTGVVVACGPTVDEFAIGDRVCTEAQSGCGRCVNCLTGHRTICQNFANINKGHKATGLTINGGFAEYALHNVDALHRIPPASSFEDAVLITTAGTGLYGLDAVGNSIAGQDVALFGPGPLGLMTVQLCKQLGAGHVILVGTRESRLQAGRMLGADHTINASRVDPVRALWDLTDGAGVDLAFEASGASNVPQQCVEITKPGGKIVVVAYYEDKVTIDLSTLVRKNVTLHTARGEGGTSMKRALALAAQGKLRGAELVTHRFTLTNIADAFRVVRGRTGEPIKVVVTPNR